MPDCIPRFPKPTTPVLHHSITPIVSHSVAPIGVYALDITVSINSLRLPRRCDVAFAETVESHRVVVEHFSFKFIGEIPARFQVWQVAAELVALALVREIGRPHGDDVPYPSLRRCKPSSIHWSKRIQNSVRWTQKTILGTGF
jgi:hypothetical protein